MLNVFRRDGAAVRHFWGSELLYGPTDPGQDPRHLGTIEPLWNPLFAIGNTLSDVLPNAEFRPAGEKVSVRGVLGVGPLSSAPVGCDSSCCSQMFAPVVLAGATDVLGLPGLWCQGDESQLCCDAPAYGQTVIATGRLGHGRDGWMLDDPEICIVWP